MTKRSNFWYIGTFYFFKNRGLGVTGTQRLKMPTPIKSCLIFKVLIKIGKAQIRGP